MRALMLSHSGYPAVERWGPALTLYIVGLTIKILVDLAKHWLKGRVGTGVEPLIKTVLIYLDSLFSVVMWVGGFYSLYWLFPAERWYQLLAVLLLSSVTLVTFRAFYSTAGTPLTVFQGLGSLYSAGF